MPNVTRVPIRSNQTEADPRPWFNLEWDGSSIQVGNDNSCFGSAQKGAHRCAINQGICQTYKGERTDIKGNLYSEMDWIFCMLMDGEFAFLPASALPNILMAHLGIYNPATDELRLLEFVE